jgi:hypothetical protein
MQRQMESGGERPEDAAKEIVVLHDPTAKSS